MTEDTRRSADSAAIQDALVTLVRIPTVSGDEAAAEPFFERWFSERGWQLDRQVFASTAAAVTTRGAAEMRPHERANLFGWLGRPSGKPVVTLNAHYDVVPIIDPEDWGFPPFDGTTRDGVVYGRGTADNKGGVIAALAALDLLSATNRRLPFDVVVELIMAEETTGIGTVAALEHIPDRRAAIVFEPTGGDVVAANSGALYFTIDVTGLAVHTSVPWRGEDALRGLVLLYDAINEFGERRTRERQHPLMSHLPSAVPTVVGTLHGGSWRAAVPAHATMSGRIGVLPGEPLEDVRTQLEQVIREVAASPTWPTTSEPQLTWDNDGLPGWEIDVDDPLVVAFAEGQVASGEERRVVGLSAGCDAGTLHRAGVPTIVFGPGDMSVAHSPREHVRIADVARAAEVIAAGLLHLADHDEGQS